MYILDTIRNTAIWTPLESRNLLVYFKNSLVYFNDLLSRCSWQFTYSFHTMSNRTVFCQSILFGVHKWDSVSSSTRNVSWDRSQDNEELHSQIRSGWWRNSDTESFRVGSVPVIPHVLGDCAFSICTNVMKKTSVKKQLVDFGIKPKERKTSETWIPIKCGFRIL